MAVTNITDLATKVAAIQARTDAAGTPVTDVDGEELRLYASIMTPGVMADDDWEVKPGTGMALDVGGGTPDSDVAVVAGTGGQGLYMVRKDLGIVPVPLGAADLALNRIDEVYVVVDDNSYDASGRGLPLLAVRQGDNAVSPVAPGPDVAWKAFYLLATVSVGAGAVSLVTGDISDNRERVSTSLIVSPGDIGAVPQTEFDAHLADFANPHQVDVSQLDTYDTATIDSLLTGKAAAIHNHAGEQITSGIIPNARLTGATTGTAGIVKLSSSVTSTSVTIAATSQAAKSAYDKGNHSHPYQPTGQYLILNGSAGGTQVVAGYVQMARVLVLQGTNTSPGVVFLESSNDTGLYGNDSLGRVGLTIDGGVSDYVWSNSGFSTLVGGRNLGSSGFPWGSLSYSGSLNPVSDPRLKKDMRSLADDLPGSALDVVLAVDPIVFNWRKDSGYEGFATRRKGGFDAKQMRSATGGLGSWEDHEDTDPEKVTSLVLDEALAILWAAVRELAPVPPPAL